MTAVPRALRALRGSLCLTIACAMPLAAQAVSSARVVVDAARAEGEIAPTMYGQFLEFMFQGVKGGLHAELLRDRGFEGAPSAIGLPRAWERYPDDRNDDYGLAFRWDDSVAYPVSDTLLDPRPVRHALRVDAGRGVVERHGVYQPRVPVRAGVAYRGYLWLKTTGYAGRVVVALEPDADASLAGGRAYAEAEIAGVSAGDWAKYEFVLRPTRADPLARFAVLFYGRGRVWVDQASLVPDDARAGGVRADVFERVAALRPAFLRWPGGNVAQDYHWAWGVGPRDRRPEWVNLSWRNEPEPSDFGTDEYVAFARAVGAEPALTVNVEGRGATPEEAAAWVEYANGPAASRYGALRAANGHPAPYGVTYWEVGNEIWGDWVRGHSDAETYARNFRRYHDAMRAVDSTIRFIAVGDNDLAWNRTVLHAAGGLIDYLAVHHYYGFDSTQRDPARLLARPLYYERFYQDLGRLIAEEVPNGHAVRLAVNEWGLDLPEARQHSLDAALYGARLMNVFERSAPLVGMSAVSDLVNGWPGGIIQAGRQALFVTPLYHAVRMWAAHSGRERLRAEVASPLADTGRAGARAGVPVLDVAASRSADGARIYLKMVNADPARPVAVRVELRGARVAPDAEWEVLASADPAARNGFDTPDAVAPRRQALRAGASFTVRLPPRSASVVTVRVVR